MKLISLYIENFGGMSRYALNLEDGLTVIEEANGFGKTTLAEFIRAMFYGFPRKGKTLDKSRRQKYTPWNGGKCGGNLVFEVDGCRYRVERTFGAVPKADTFTLIDLSTNKKSTRYTEELGLELFRLDGDSFERSTYLPQMSEGGNLTTDSIRSKLSNLVEDTNDVGNFEKAIAALKAKRSTFVPYRGGGGSVMRANSQVSRLQEQIESAQNQKSRLEICDREIETLQQQENQLQERLNQVRREIRHSSEAAATAAVHREYGQLVRQHEEAKRACRELEERYPHGIPEWNRIEAARNAADRLEILNSRELTERDDLDAEAYLEANRSRFESRLPTDEALETCRNRCGEHAALRSRIMELAGKLTEQPAVKINVLPLVLMIAVCIGAMATGTVLLADVPAWGYVSMGIGAVALIGAIIAAIRLSAARKQLKQFLREQAEIRTEMDRLNARADRLAEEIESFLSAYGTVAGKEFYSLLAELKHSAEDYLRAKSRVEQWRKGKAAHEEEVARWNALLTAFFESAGLIRQEQVSRQLLQIRDDRKDWEETVQDMNSLAAERKIFEEANADRLNRPLPEVQYDLELLRREEIDLTGTVHAVSEELIRRRQHRELLQEQVRSIPQLQDELQFWQEKKIADQKNSDLLDDTMALLEQARENLSVAYMGPIRRSFAQLLERLWGKQEGQVLVTPELEVQLERSGAARELGYFSAGQTDLVMLCMRLALVDALFGKEKPFVVLDDPFVNLDDARTDEALELLKELARDRQILYLTCNSSRIPK